MFRGRFDLAHLAQGRSAFHQSQRRAAIQSDARKTEFSGLRNSISGRSELRATAGRRLFVPNLKFQVPDFGSQIPKPSNKLRFNLIENDNGDFPGAAFLIYLIS
jgi:hypothetical protein